MMTIWVLWLLVLPVHQYAPEDYHPKVQAMWFQTQTECEQHRQALTQEVLLRKRFEEQLGQRNTLGIVQVGACEALSRKDF